MITVSISINTEPIFTRTATRIKGENGEVCTYKVDDGRIIKHKPNEGAIKLAIEMLKGIKEVK